VVATLLDSGRRRYYETQPNVCIRAMEWLKSSYYGLRPRCHMLHDQPDHLEQRRIAYSSV
jgi:hypothetical protein